MTELVMVLGAVLLAGAFGFVLGGSCMGYVQLQCTECSRVESESIRQRTPAADSAFRSGV